MFGAVGIAAQALAAANGGLRSKRLGTNGFETLLIGSMILATT